LSELLDDLLDDQSDRWSNGSPRLVEDYLAESAGLRGDTEQVLDLIYHEVLLRQRAGESPELAEYVRRFPELERQLQVHFAVHEALESGGGWAGEGQAEPQPGSPSPAGPPGCVGRFELLRFHARGGLGEVFVARDGELPREVAFKRLQPRHAQDADSRARFVREAEITSRLDHPSIVPVYGLLHDDDGRPGYAMRLIHGESMSVAIGRLYGSAAGPAAAAERPADEAGDEAGNEAGDVADRGEVRRALSAGQRRLALHRLLARFVAACHAVAYAHSQGVLHRDLKPANIMLGPYGETLVIDWGLAREVSAERAVRQPVVPLDLGVSCAETRPGELLGTPAFMSPEQAAGDWKRVGPASDIYSLGATLYAILTGTTPFADTEPRKLLASVRQGQFPPPRQRRPDVPGALEAVCLRALALRPEDRYATAQALADDIDRWLADEPVTARRPPWTERLARWIRRRPAWVHAGFTALLVATIAAVVLQFAHDRTRQAEQVARQRQYLSAVATFHEALGQAELGDHRTAAESYLAAIRTLDPLLEDMPEARARRAVCYNNLAALYLEAGELPEAEQMLLQARKPFEESVRDEPANAGHHHLLAAALRKLGMVYARQGHVADAEQTLQQAIDTLHSSTVGSDARHEHVSCLARTHFDLAELRSRRGDRARAEQDYREAISLAERAVQRAEAATGHAAWQYPEHRRLLADSLDALARWHDAQSRPADSAAATAQARECRRELARRQQRAGQRWLEDRNLVQAHAAFEESLDLFLATDAKDDHQALAAAWHGLGEAHQRAGRPQLAERAFERERDLAPPPVHDSRANGRNKVTRSVSEGGGNRPVPR
jgi:serine/threonine protein kinase